MASSSATILHSVSASPNASPKALSSCHSQLLVKSKEKKTQNQKMDDDYYTDEIVKEIISAIEGLISISPDDTESHVDGYIPYHKYARKDTPYYKNEVPTISINDFLMPFLDKHYRLGSEVFIGMFIYLSRYIAKKPDKLDPHNIHLLLLLSLNLAQKMLDEVSYSNSNMLVLANLDAKWMGADKKTSPEKVFARLEKQFCYDLEYVTHITSENYNQLRDSIYGWMKERNEDFLRLVSDYIESKCKRESVTPVFDYLNCFNHAVIPQEKKDKEHTENDEDDKRTTWFVLKENNFLVMLLYLDRYNDFTQSNMHLLIVASLLVANKQLHAMSPHEIQLYPDTMFARLGSVSCAELKAMEKAMTQKINLEFNSAELDEVESRMDALSFEPEIPVPASSTSVSSLGSSAAMFSPSSSPEASTSVSSLESSTAMFSSSASPSPPPSASPSTCPS